MGTTDKAYVLQGTEGELLLVVRSQDVDLLHSIVRRMGRMRDPRIKDMGKKMQEELNDIGRF